MKQMSREELFSHIKMVDGKYITEYVTMTISKHHAAIILNLSPKTVWRMTLRKEIKTTNTGQITLGYLVEYLNNSGE